jgi:hypothetical protein
VQDFIPTPMAIATAMFYTGIDPLTMEPVAVVRDLRDKKLMKSLLYWWDPAQHDLAREALRRAGRTDLVGNGPRCLVPYGSQRRESGPKNRGAPSAPAGTRRRPGARPR